MALFESLHVDIPSIINAQTDSMESRLKDGEG